MVRDGLSLASCFALVSGAAAVTSALATPVFARWARRAGLVSRPGPRRDHQEEIPLLGGAAILGTFLLGVGGAALVLTTPGIRAGIADVLPMSSELLASVSPGAATWTALSGLCGAAILVFLFGLADDRVGDSFSPWKKVAGQGVGAVILWMSGVRSDLFDGGAMDFVLTLLWVLAVTNAFNLLDNMDGLVAGVAALSCSLLLSVAAGQGQILVGGILALLLGAVLGFLPHNFPRARVFLGDAGSQVLGLLLAGLALVESYVTPSGPGLAPVAIPVLVLLVPLFDTAWVVQRRLRERRPLAVGDTSHLSHCLVRLGLSRPQAVLVHWLLTLGCGSTAALLPWLPPTGVLLVLVQSLATLCLVGLLVGAASRARQVG
jgi:UDP-GlcNAc:undecaprenyl-phosphate GlcNAc-1-phosphate transferase